MLKPFRITKTYHSNILPKPRWGFSAIIITFILLFNLVGPPISPVFAIDTPSPLTPVVRATITAVNEPDAIAIPPVALPEFSWTAVEGATEYRLQLSQDRAFSTKYEFTTPHTSFIPTSITHINDGVWYWRVMVTKPETSFYSSYSEFTKQWASPSNYPLLNSPATGAVIEFYDYPTFSWDPVVGAASYQFQISASPEFSVLLVNINTLGTTYQHPIRLANGIYYWRVIPRDTANRDGIASVVRSFELQYNQIPNPLEPVGTFQSPATPTFTPTFRWTAVRGSEKYQLQYSTDNTFNTDLTTVETRNTSYTPLRSLPNDTNYYWRVRAHSGVSISRWSPVNVFKKQWYITPKLLTPTNVFPNIRVPYYSWTPVPGASYYKIEIDDSIDFQTPLSPIGQSANPFYVPERHNLGFFDTTDYYWRVIPFDHNNNQGVPSAPDSFGSLLISFSPELVYPLYYYPPNDFPDEDPDIAMQPHEDRTVALPVFMWHRVTVPNPVGGTFAPAYRLQVDDDPLFLSLDWTVDTENIVAAPTTTTIQSFNPTPGIDYYWRVCPLTSLGGDCHENPYSQPWWSQVWRSRIDTTQTLTPTTGASPLLLRPVQGSEQVEMTPLFEWWPMQGADNYEIQISDDPNFGTIVDTNTVPYPAYAPGTMLAQRELLNRLNYGTYYWRVRALSSGSPLGDWSETWRFQVASQSLWKPARIMGTGNQVQVANDPTDNADSNYELTTLFAAQDADKWFFGFDATATATDMVYGLYLDVDHLDNSGATYDPRGYTATTISAHQPEYAIYIIQSGEDYSAAQVAIYAWEGSTWGTPQILNTIINGDIYWDGSYLEIQVPNTAIGMDPTTGSYALSLMSFPTASGSSPQDSVPSDPNVPGSALISRFASVSDKMMPITPPNNSEGDPTTFASIHPFAWEQPTGSNGSTPWAGQNVEVNLDPRFTGDPAAELNVVATIPYLSSNTNAWKKDFLGDNSYYWRVQARYLDGSTALFGAWSEPRKLERVGFVPQNLQESVTFATPTFTWNLVEGAETYDIALDDDPNFGSPKVWNTAQNSLTPTEAYANGTYYWRVRIRRWGSVINEWSQVESFTLDLPKPTGLQPDDPDELSVIHKSPTLCWQPLIVEVDGVPVLAAYKYRVEVSKGDPTFSTIYERIDTQQSCWTPTKGYDDGKYYWHVAMIDGQNHIGDFSDIAEFTKQYPITSLISPLSGAAITDIPTFVWTPVQGAASYKLEISKNSTFSPIYDSIITDNTRYTSTKIYDEFTPNYFWRVAMIDDDNKYGPFNDAAIILDHVYLPLIQRE